MVSGGGHSENNPHDYKKGPKRGDKKREEKRGRKRIDQVDRKKANSPISLITTVDFEEFIEDEAKVIYALDKGSNYGNRSRDLEQMALNRKIRKNSIPSFIETFKRKMEARDWGTVHVGHDGKIYISLNQEKKEIISKYVEFMRQSSASDIVKP